MIYNFLQHYFNYYVLFGWSILEGEVGLALGGTFAKYGKMEFLYVVLIAVCGAYLSDISVFLIGRHYKDKIDVRFEKYKDNIIKIKSLFKKYGSWVIIFERYIYGSHIPALLTVGASGYSFVKFIFLDLLGVVFWALTFVSLGYYFGHNIIELINLISKYFSVIVFFIIFVFVIKSSNQ